MKISLFLAVSIALVAGVSGQGNSNPHPGPVTNCCYNTATKTCRQPVGACGSNERYDHACC